MTYLVPGGPCVVCGDPHANNHHRKLRSQGGGEDHWNLIRLCGSGTTGCHGLVHAHPSLGYASGLLVHFWADPEEVPLVPMIFTEGLASEFVSGLAEVAEHDHAEVEAGEKCPTCHRRVPHPKKKTSPVTKVMGVRVPIDDVETFEEQINAAAEYLGCLSKPHWKFWVWQYALVALLQSPELEGALRDAV